ncbi:MAG: nucleotidyltransferase [Anaerolineales bacterium]|nr:nucleotidyltransferase [Anaerolineales bacterium]
MGKAQRKSDRPAPESITPLQTPLQALQNLLSEFNNQGVIIGGIAASLLGAPRYTVDLDAVFLLSTADIPRLIRVAATLGIEPRIANVEAFAQKSRVLLLRHAASGTGIDLSLGVLPFEIEMVERSQVFEVGSLMLRLPTPEDLIILKAVAHRAKDLADIQAIAASHPDLDRSRIRYWVEQFGEVLDLPDLWGNIEKLL